MISTDDKIIQERLHHFNARDFVQRVCASLGFWFHPNFIFLPSSGFKSDYGHPSNTSFGCECLPCLTHTTGWCHCGWNSEMVYWWLWFIYMAAGQLPSLPSWQERPVFEKLLVLLLEAGRWEKKQLMFCTQSSGKFGICLGIMASMLCWRLWC
jgi:hypothetical protein